MQFFGSCAFAALGILAAAQASAATKGAESPCESFEDAYGGTCVSGAVDEGRAPWLVGVAKRLEPADIHDLFEASTAHPGPVDFSALPSLTTSTSVPFRVGVGRGWSKIDVERNGVALSDVRVSKGVARTRLPVSLDAGVNLFTVRLHDGKRAPVEVHAAVRKLGADQVEELAIARAYLAEVGPLLGADASNAVLLPTRFQSFAPEADKDAPALVRIGFRAAIAGVPVDGAGVSVMLTRDPRTKKPVPVGIYNGLPDLSKAPLELPKTAGSANARRALAREYAGGDERFVSQPHLRWRAHAEGRFELVYHAFFYGLHSAEGGFATDEAFTIARLWTDAATVSHHEYFDLLRRQFALTGRGHVFDGPLHDLDEALAVHSIELDETRRNIEGEHEWCASGPYAQVKNDSESRHLAYNSRGRLVCGGLDRHAVPDLYPHAAPSVEDTVGSAAEDALEAWTAFSHMNRVAAFVQRHAGFVHDFPRRERRSQLLVGINPQFRGYAVATASTVETIADEVVWRQAVFFGQEVRYGITTYDRNAYFMAGDFSRDRNTVYHEFGHTILNALGVTTYWAFGDGIVGTVHEGFADYLARVMTGNDRQPSEFLYEEPEEHPDARARYCAPLLPGDEHFLVLDADNLDRTLATVDWAYRGHVFGQSFCQVLALTEDRLAERTDAADHAVLQLVVAAASDFPNRAWRHDESDVFVDPLLFASVARWTIDSFHGNDTQPTDHELRTALALHGFTGDRFGRTAAFTLEGGAHRFYGDDEALEYTVATGVNPKYTMTFSRDRDGNDECHSISGETERIDQARTTRAGAGQVTVSELVEECGGLGRIFVSVSSCDDTAGCDDPDAEWGRALEGSPVWIDVGLG